MPNPTDKISFRLGLRRDRLRKRAWLVVPIKIGRDAALDLVPNSVATRSVISPDSYQKLRDAGLVDLDVHDLHSGRLTAVLNDVSIGDRPAPALEVQVRDVPEFKTDEGKHLVDGYLGLDYLFFGDFGSIEINTRTLWMTLRLDPRAPTN